MRISFCVAQIDVGEYAVQEQSLVCCSLYREQFTAAILSLQALLILFGVFLAWQTRKVALSFSHFNFFWVLFS